MGRYEIERMDDTSASGAADRSVSLIDALRDRNSALERLQREADSLRGELAVRDGYLADLRARLAEAEERANRATRAGEVARDRLAHIATAVYVRTSADEDGVRRRIAAAIERVSRLKDRERAQALQALRQLRRR
jgi:predicted  nucleic acid-binding Zn-ribbon protein